MGDLAPEDVCALAEQAKDADARHKLLEQGTLEFAAQQLHTCVKVIVAFCTCVLAHRTSQADLNFCRDAGLQIRTQITKHTASFWRALGYCAISARPERQ